jgi:hypothetical protein
MEIFINECSLHGQYSSKYALENAVKQLISVFDAVLPQQNSTDVYQDETVFWYQNVIENQTFQMGFEQLSPPIRNLFRVAVLQRYAPKNWKDTRLHNSEHFYFHQETVVTDTSIAEIAERNLQHSNRKRLLLNFIESGYAGLSFLPVFKEEIDKGEPIIVDCIENVADFNKWLATLPSKRNDAFLTGNPTRFQRTSTIVKGATVYLELATDYRWYIDTFHDTAPHFEVFNAQKEHLGEADIHTGIIDSSKKDAKKNNKISF